MNPASNLFLIGPMGAGKSTVGRRIAEALGMRFVDLDVEIEREAGCRISELFARDGEAGFRERESALLLQLAAEDGIVLATGGGTVLAPANRKLLAARGFVIYLSVPVHLQLERLARDQSRPLLQGPDRERRLRQLAAQRNPIYRELADLTVSANRCGPAVSSRRCLAALGRYWQALPPARFPESLLAELEGCAR
jgi:shikimate kinase